MFFFNYWSNPSRSDLEAIKFETMEDFSKELSEKGLKIHDQKRFESEVKNFKNKHFYAFPSKIKNEFALEWYTNLNQASKAQRELLDHLRRARQFA
jgi:hypothetical protein